jgi:hypothetical protein
MFGPFRAGTQVGFCSVGCTHGYSHLSPAGDVARSHMRVVACSIPDKAPDLWLRDGDVIEVPEK